MNSKRGLTLFEMMMGEKRPVTAEKKVYNPFNLRVGDSVTLNHLDHEETFYYVSRLVLFECGTGTAATCHVHYELTPKVSDDTAQIIRLQAVPLVGAHSGDPEVQASILYVHDEFGFSDDLKRILDSDDLLTLNGENDEGEYSHDYSPEDSSREPFKPQVSAFSDKDGDGFVDEQEKERYQVHFWRYSRTLSSGGDERVVVQINQNDGWTHLLVGPDVSPEAVNVFPKGE